MNEEQKMMVEYALRYLGRSTRHRDAVTRERCKITGMVMGAFITENSSAALAEIDRAAGSLWLDSEHRIPTLMETFE